VSGEIKSAWTKKDYILMLYTQTCDRYAIGRNETFVDGQVHKMELPEELAKKIGLFQRNRKGN
jgi:hypothetical protein